MNCREYVAKLNWVRFPNQYMHNQTRGWQNMDPEPRVGEGGGSGQRLEKKSDPANFDGGSGQ